MSQPIWITPSGSLGVIPEGVFYQQVMRAEVAPLPNVPTCTATTAGTNLITCTSTAGIYPGLEVVFFGTTFGGIQENYRYFVLRVASSTQFSVCLTENYDAEIPVTLTTATGVMTAQFNQHTLFTLISGKLPPGIQCSDNGLLIGVPKAVASLQGVPLDVSRDVTSKFAIRAYTLTQAGTLDAIADQTFNLTVTGNDIPEFTTPAGLIGTYYDSSFVNIQLEYTGVDPDETISISLASGELPAGLTLSNTGLIQGWAEPVPTVDAPAGYDLTGDSNYPYDFTIISTSKNFQFTCKVSDGKAATLRTFYIYIYDRSDLTADDTFLTADNTFVTADETPTRAPFLYNSVTSDLGRVRSDNYYAYQFIGNLYNGEGVGYLISVNEGFGLPPGLQLDPLTGWYYGFIPDQGTTEITYSFNIQVYDLNDPTNVSPLYPFSITITGAIDAEVTWLVPPASAGYTRVISKKYDETLDAFVTNSMFVYDLGTIDNGGTSMFYVQAVNRGGRDLQYRLRSGAYNELPQGLKLLPSGDIVGRVSFDTFALDGGTTTFDATLAVTRNIDLGETTFDSVFVFTVNAYAEATDQILYKVSSVSVLDGGSGYSSINLPTMEFSTPIGASAVQAQVGNVTVSGGAITSVEVANSGAGYSSPATLTITQGFGGSGAVLEPVMVATGTRDVISVYRTFSIKVTRAYNKPYQNLYVEAMPPENDRVIIAELLADPDIFVPDYIYRLDDPNFGIARRVTYQHAFGLSPDIFDAYVDSLYLNHYWKDLVLGPVRTAQAVDPVSGEVVYEVVYSEIVDNLVNSQGQSVSKIVNLPYSIIDPADGSTVVTQVYPNSLVDMRNQVIEVVGQISKKLPLWMTSKQANGTTLGFTPAWVMCYAKPGRGKQIAYEFSRNFTKNLNAIDFKVDRYVLDRTLSKNWNADTQHWIPTPPNLTTFDRFNTSGYTYIGQVSCATNLAFADINRRDINYINSLGGIDGQTWVAVPGRTPPPGTKVVIRDGSTIIFVKQENYDGPPGSSYPTATAAWQNYLYPFDSIPFDATDTEYDESIALSGGILIGCTDTTSGTNKITCDSTGDLNLNQAITFTGTTFGGIDTGTTYYIKSIISSTEFTVSLTPGGTVLSLTTDSGDMVGRPANLRMAIYTINIAAEGQITLTLTTQTQSTQWVQVTQGTNFFSAQLYYPGSPGTNLTRISWLALPTVVTTETIFDQGSMQFVDPVDMYDASQTYDKYLVFPKSNILV